MSDVNLSDNPQRISKTIWYYEEPRGIHIYHQVRMPGFITVETHDFFIPWGKLKTSLKRKEDKSWTRK